MSFIVYGPQGCGKSLNAERLRKALGCSRVISDDEADFPRDLYGRLATLRGAQAFKAGTDLFLTNEPPPAGFDADHSRRVIHFDEAMRLAGAAARGA